MNVDTFRKCAEVMSIATEYDAYYRDSLEYTDEQIADKLASADGGYDQFVYRYFYVAAEQIEETQYEGDEAGLEAAQAAALAEAKKVADKYRAGIKSEDDFIAAAKDYDPDMLSEQDSTKYSYRGSQLSEMFKEWIMQSSRTAGDTAVLEGASGYYVVYFISRDANDYNTVDIRAISIAPETVNQADYEDDEEGYNKAVEAALDAAEDKAEKLYDEWKAEGGTEELFIQYANEHSADAAAAEGGLFENIYKNALSEELNDWCFAAARKAGDSTVIRSDMDNGCFLLWYVGESDVYRDYLAETDLRNADYQQWYTELTENSEVDYKLLFRLTK